MWQVVSYRDIFYSNNRQHSAEGASAFPPYNQYCGARNLRCAKNNQSARNQSQCGSQGMYCGEFVILSAAKNRQFSENQPPQKQILRRIAPQNDNHIMNAKNPSTKNSTTAITRTNRLPRQTLRPWPPPAKSKKSTRSRVKSPLSMGPSNIWTCRE